MKACMQAAKMTMKHIDVVALLFSNLLRAGGSNSFTLQDTHSSAVLTHIHHANSWHTDEVVSNRQEVKGKLLKKSLGLWLGF